MGEDPFLNTPRRRDFLLKLLLLEEMGIGSPGISSSGFAWKRPENRFLTIGRGVELLRGRVASTSARKNSVMVTGTLGEAGREAVNMASWDASRPFPVFSRIYSRRWASKESAKACFQQHVQSSCF